MSNKNNSSNEKLIVEEKIRKAKQYTNGFDEMKSGERRGIIFSRIPSKQNNPDRYDNLIHFWSQSIQDVSKSCNVLIQTTKTLQQVFTIDNVSPMFLPLILIEMEKLGLIQRYEHYLAAQTSDIGWSKWLWSKCVVSPIQHYSGYSESQLQQQYQNPNTKFLVPSVIKEKAESLYQGQIEQIKSMTDNIVSYSRLEKSLLEWRISKEELDLLIQTLVKCGKAVIIYHNKEKRGIKFAVDESTRVQPEKSDYGILQLQNTKETLRIQEDNLVLDIERIQDDLQKSIRAKQKNHALLHLKRKKKLEDILLKRRDANSKIEDLLYSIESAQSNQQIYETLITGVSTLKTVNEKLTVDQVDNIMDDYQDAMANQREIDEVVRTGLGSIDSMSSIDVDEDQLEKELEQMEKDQEKEKLEKERLEKEKLEKSNVSKVSLSSSSSSNPLPIPTKDEEDELLKELESLQIEQVEKPKKQLVMESN
ncbi:hypothetical protein CYY_004860 [Polysphondylium violaceum]|uniref:SNF7 family protein n=1 Tax=Polysphondylium violaceum TaxID=133409 RepID=A0A8J4PSP6_9MYCE|nr:hypothetical protein CYY_004860 [Polysphondylium violaceum]